jgi:hypothetical protein
MQVHVIPIPEIVQIVKIVRLSLDPGKDDDDEFDDDGESVSASVGLYCMDSQGGLWKKMKLATDLLTGFDFADPQLAKERIEGHKRRQRKKKPKPRRVK